MLVRSAASRTRKENAAMTKGAVPWKRGRGKLGILAPLLGSWRATAFTPMGTVQCMRTFSSVLGSKYIELRAQWDFGNGIYEELALYGVDAEGMLGFWAFTSDGKHSRGRLADV